MLLGYISHYIFGISIFLTSMFLIMLVLVQRGRGGGIAGALGGAGGQSAFGTKAGDLFTRITVGVATFWILLCVVAILSLREREFTTGVDRQQAKSGTASGLEPVAGTESAGTESAGAEVADGSTTSGSQAVAPAESNTAESNTAESNTVQPAGSVQPPDSSQPEASTVAPEVSELDSSNPVTNPE